MGPPAFLFVVRHGFRLDAADKQWHLSSPTPYDPPLTYNGWQQAKSLGARIASIIRDKIDEDEEAASLSENPGAKQKHKRYKVVLHSSPFLRCIQTAIAISAGLAQDSTPFVPKTCLARYPTPPSDQDAQTRPAVTTDVRDTRNPTSGFNSAVQIQRSVLRLDGFLGEWLSPGYFELITPPPESVMMIASAKADLLRREDYSHYPNLSGHSHSNSRGQLWSPVGRSSPFPPPNDSQSDRGRGVPGVVSSSSRSASVSSHSSQNSQNQRPSTPRRQGPGYISPVPHYAVSNNNTIPPGYVSHARDACVDIDYQWDSTRPPLNWGDGGTFPEEWPEMHKRFRTGVQRLVDWYSTAENPTAMVTAVPPSFRKESADSFLDDAEDVETEAVVILVSHGAGCNALIGAITHQPVLMEVGMASLTMAVRKSNEQACGNDGMRPPDTRRATPPIHELYDLKLFASTEHLRSPAPTPTSARPPLVSNAFNSARGRHLSFSTQPYDSPWNDTTGSRSSSANAALSSLRRGSNGVSSRNPPFPSNNGVTVGSGVTSFPKAKPIVPTLGLWSPSTSRDEDEDDDALFPNFANVGAAAVEAASEVPRTTTVVDSAHGSTEKASASSAKSPQLGAGAGGLWGSGLRSTSDEGDRIRDLSPTKRRWTVAERS
ncbi:hypothetical protein N656DRAFT_800858 [Canariomyces notabilis]|uniref:Phosphoglycerate mutase n=1 Tax=Canariomyces notabilis TaxID=2074819 RepID=A0AAN6QIY4_9PEZI|nr:hypothetical protein N656DRAFT_800858 [Canariomyces arenarius]